jgi:hypothetical protein
MTHPQPNFVAQFVERCGAAKDGCATNAPSGHILWRTPTVRSRFVAHVVAQPLWRNPQPIAAIIARVLAKAGIDA